MNRVYLQCDQCDFKFIELLDKGDPMPECPQCEGDAAHDADGEQQAKDARFQRMLASGIPPAVRSNRSRAVDIAQHAMEDMGHTNFKDGTRAGESIVKGPAPAQTAETDQLIQEVAQYTEQTRGPMLNHLSPEEARKQIANAWKGGGANIALPDVINQAKAGAEAARKMGTAPMAMLQEARDRPMGNNFQVMSAAKK